MKRRFVALKNSLKKLAGEFKDFNSFLFSFLKAKVVRSSLYFEKNKNSLVKLFMVKRGRYNRLFLHFSTIGVLGIGLITAPFLASTYPVFSANTEEDLIIDSKTEKSQPIAVDDDVFHTKISQKPRDKIIEYRVERGDTVSTIAQKFGISEDTIRWENNMSNDNITVGDTLRILPVTGMAYKVSSGESVYTIAQKLDTNPQQIVDFPFNEFANPETFSLIEGQILIVPDGIKPSAPRPVAPKRTYIAQGPTSVSSTGLAWPLTGGISQYASWYHMAIDITNAVGTPIVAAQSGTVTKALVGTWDGGYGTNVMVDNGGVKTLYAHLSSVNVSVGDTVEAGKTVIGWVGMTGRTTGPHLHFEVYKNGVLVNPLSYL